mmetsp:Transcript_18083/g.41665  ORF Transcript_18083/g.41665 Transcript_18083/m.41665 type:complete len:207 (-) Transcript_18083:188-808(-)
MQTMKYDTPNPQPTKPWKKRPLVVSSCAFLATFFVSLLAIGSSVSAFQSSSLILPACPLVTEHRHRHRNGNRRGNARIGMAQVSEQDAKKAIDSVVKALRSDAAAKNELGNLKKVENVLGYGSPQKGKLAVRFNASFQKGGSGFLGFGSLGKKKEGDSNKNKAPENQRGKMVGQVKASIDQSTGKVMECSVFRDLGYGRAFNLKTR